MIDRGTDLHHRALNRTGIVLDGTDKKNIVVMTVVGKEIWNIDDCDVIERFD